MQKNTSRKCKKIDIKLNKFYDVMEKLIKYSTKYMFSGQK
jgi:hypothetical protein